MLEILTGRLYLLVLLEHPNQKWNLGWNVVYTCAENLDITSWTMPFLLYLLEFLIFWYLSFRPTLEKKTSLAMTVFLSLGVFLSNLSIQLPIDFYKTSLLEVYDVFEMTLGLWSSLFRDRLFNLSFTTGSRSRREGLKVFQRFRPHWEVLRNGPCTECPVASLRKFGIREKSETKIFKGDRDVVDISDDADDVIGLNYRLLIRFNYPRTYLFTS